MSDSRQRRTTRRSTETVEDADRRLRVAGQGPHPLTVLQQRAGNRAAAALLARAQAKLEVGAADDPFEREADLVARSVVAALNNPQHVHGTDQPETLEGDERPAGHRIGRRAEPVGAEGGTLDRQTEADVMTARGGGAPLAQPVRARFESAMGVELAGVRLHTGPEATRLSEQMSARAFTLGQDIFFRDGAPDVTTGSGQELLAHELAHTVQQCGGGAARRKTVKAAQPKAGLDVVDDWVKYSAVRGKPRSTELKRIDAAVATWVNGSRKLGGAIDGNIHDLTAILHAILAWQATKKDESVRRVAIKDLTDSVTGTLDSFLARQQKKQADEATAADLFGKFTRIDAATGKYAGKNTTDIDQSRFLPDRQTAGLMAHTRKNADGTLTDEALDELDDAQREDARKLVETARGAKIVFERDMDDDEIRSVAEKDKNALTGRTNLPELANLTDANGEAEGEVTEDVAVSGSTLHVTYDRSDVHAAERLASLREAVRLVNATKVKVPELDVYLPKLSRTIKVKNDCSVTVGGKIADAVFHAPNFLAVSSANTGVAKTDKVGDQLKFLSAALGPDQALVHTLIHEIGHALHYHNSRKQFYNLNFAFFKGKATDGRSYQEIAQTEVSDYGSNPREMVAEVFVGAVTGKKKFSAVVWEMYVGLGGADPR